MSELILHPGAIELRKRRDRLRGQLATLVRERLAIIFDELPALRYRYEELFGEIEREIQAKTLEMSERKRMMELFLLKIDRGQTLDKETIDLTLKAVYREFARLRGEVERIAKSEAEKEPVWSAVGKKDHEKGARFRTREEKNREVRLEIKQHYRQLAKRLHPDIAPTDDPLVRTYWELTQSAYERDDLDLLRTLVNIVETGPGVGKGRISSSTAEEIVRLLGLINDEEKRIAELKLSDPYRSGEKLEDGEWVRGTMDRLRRKVEEIERETARFNEFLAPILSRGGKRITPDSFETLWTNFFDEAYFGGRR